MMVELLIEWIRVLKKICWRIQLKKERWNHMLHVDPILYECLFILYHIHRASLGCVLYYDRSSTRNESLYQRSMFLIETSSIIIEVNSSRFLNSSAIFSQKDISAMKNVKHSLQSQLAVCRSKIIHKRNFFHLYEALIPSSNILIEQFLKRSQLPRHD